MAVVGGRMDRDAGVRSAAKTTIHEEGPMRVLLAIDGSSCSDAATRLVAGLAWPEGTSILVLAVEEPRPAAAAGLAPFPVADAYGDADLTDVLTATLAEAVHRLDAPGRWVESRLLHGRAATVIVE